MDLQQTKREITDNQLSCSLPMDHLEKVEAWGRASSSVGYVFRPSVVDELAELFVVARRLGLTVGFKGGGNSYGDAFSNSEQIVLDTSRLNRILAWEPDSGRVTVEPGVTMTQLWRYVLQDGWWPPIVTGTAKTTVGGNAAMNTHGKNGWRKGTFGDHVLEFELLMPSGETIVCSREENADIFHAAIGGAGLLGCFTSLTLQMTRIYSGLLNVEAVARPNLDGLIEYFDEHVDRSDYIVGWVDAFAKGSNIGRGEIHRADYLAEGEDRYPAQTMRLDAQGVPDTLFWFVPKSALWRFARPLTNNLGFRMVNAAKYFMAVRNEGHTYRQSHVAFHFLLDYMPNWKYSYGPDGLIQYQVFLPKETAAEGFKQIFRTCQRKGRPNYLSVLKRHRPDDFLMTYSLDGYSMAMDFKITRRNRAEIVKLTRELDGIVLEAGGRFYFAKDSTLRPEVARAYLGEETIAEFKELKERCDPEGLIQTDLWRRVFG